MFFYENLILLVLIFIFVCFSLYAHDNLHSIFPTVFAQLGCTQAIGVTNRSFTDAQMPSKAQACQYPIRSK